MRTFAPKPKATQQTTSAKSPMFGGGHFGQSPEVSTTGNQAVPRLLETDTQQVKRDLTATATARSGGDFSETPVFAPDGQDRSQMPGAFIQADKATGQVDARLEHEADRIADNVMRQKSSDVSLPAATAHVSRDGITGEGKEAKTVPRTQRNLSNADGCIPQEIRALQGGGSPLPQSRRPFFESTLGHDFAKVRIHSDSGAAALARAVNARAFTFGQDIVFGAGQYSPETGEGTRLLAHELVHVVQQQTSPASIQRKSDPDYFGPGGVEEQLDILFEGEGLPLKLFQQPDIRHLSSSEITVLSFQRKLGAIIKLGDLRHKNAVTTLVRIAENKLYVSPHGFTPDQKLQLQQQALIALGKIGTPEAIKKLTDLLSSNDPKERSQSVGAFSEATGTAMPYWQVVPTAQLAATLLAQLNKEKDVGVKSTIIRALGNLGSQLSGNKEKQLVVTELIREMESNTGNLQFAAVTALGKVRLKSATEPLLKQLKLWHSVDHLAVEIILSLGEIGDVSAVDYLVIFLEKHGSWQVRSQAATALGKIGGAKAIGALKARLTQETHELVKQAISKALP